MMLKTITLFMLCLSSIVIADITDGKLEIEKIAEGVYLHTSYKALGKSGYFPSNGLVVVEGQDAFIIDTPWPESDTEKLVDWIKRSGFNLKASLSTHFHEDRTSGIAYLNHLKVKTVASDLTNRLLLAQDRTRAGVSFDGNEFELLKGVIQAYYPGPGHTADNVVVWLPKVKILFGGCLIRNSSTQSMGNVADANVSEWGNTVQRVIDKFPTAKVVIPGHGDIGKSNLLLHTKTLAMQAKAVSSKPVSHQ